MFEKSYEVINLTYFKHFPVDLTSNFSSLIFVLNKNAFQLALAAVLHSASKEQENLDSYVTECLFQNATDKLPVLIEAVRSKDA